MPSTIKKRYRLLPALMFSAAMALAAVVTQVAVPLAPAHGATIGGGRTEFYVSPNGDDSGPGSDDDPFRTLQRARDAVRDANDNMHSNIVVNIEGGTYVLDHPLELGPQDSGTNGYDVVYRAAPGSTPVISGGRQITGWSLYDKSANIYRAYVGNLQTRQLFVNGTRATRARGAANPAGFTETSTGYTTTDTQMASWRNQSDIEVVSRFNWKEFRCPVSSIDGTNITMQEPCWHNANLHTCCSIGRPAWIENAYELLDQADEWYLDQKTGYLYYIPRAGQDMAKADVVAPVLQSLVRGDGTLDEPLHNVSFQGLTFAYSTWLAPSTDEGYAVVQSGFRITGSDNPDFASTRTKWVKTPAAVTFQNVHGLELEGNTFTHLGAVGLNLESGSQENQVTGNRFTDISASGMQIGGVDVVDHHPSDPRQIVKDNAVTNNVITGIGAEYHDGVGIWDGYTQHTTVAHNLLYNLPYSGIVMGWGWGLFDQGGNPYYAPDNGQVPVYSTPTTSRDNLIANNRIEDVMQALFDGGAIYMLGASPGTEVTGNYIRGQHNEFGALYPDEGSAYLTFKNNVVQQTVRWLHVWTPSIHDLVIENNYHDNNTQTMNGRNITLRNNQFVSDPSVLPASIIDAAGLQPAYADLAPTAPPGDSTAPTAPQNLRVTATLPTSVRLTWDASTDDTGVTGYEIDQNGQLVGVSATPSFAVDGLTPDTTYEFTVRARDAAANLSGPSSDVAIHMPPADTTAPDTPQRPTANVDSATVVDLSWPAVSDDWGVTKYEVYQDNRLVAQPVEPSAQISGLVPGQTYAFTIRARDAAGNVSDPSPAVQVTMPANANLALGRPARALFIDGSPAVMQPGSSPGDGVDGDLSTAAQASDQYRWQFEVDLGSVKDIGSIVTRMPSRAYATDFDLQASSDGVDFTTVRSVHGFAAGADVEEFTSLSARYLRVVAIKPDGPGQPGGQMAITELEAYAPS